MSQQRGSREKCIHHFAALLNGMFKNVSNFGALICHRGHSIFKNLWVPFSKLRCSHTISAELKFIFKNIKLRIFQLSWGKNSPWTRDDRNLPYKFQ